MSERETQVGDMSIRYRPMPMADVGGGFLVPEELWTGYYAEPTRRERWRDRMLRLFRRSVPERRWVPGLKERLRATSVNRGRLEE